MWLAYTSKKFNNFHTRVGIYYNKKSKLFQEDKDLNVEQKEES